VGSFVAISGQKPWPSVGSFVAAYGQFFMAADIRTVRNLRNCFYTPDLNRDDRLDLLCLATTAEYVKSSETG
jgi:hypothetical protein